MKLKEKIKEIFFKYKSWQIALGGVLLLTLALFAIVEASKHMQRGWYYLFLLAMIPTIALLGGSILNKNGINFDFLLFFGIAVKAGLLPAFLIAIFACMISIYLSKRPTPIDFAIEKNFMAIVIQMLTLVIATLCILVFKVFYGMTYIMSHLFLVFFVSFAISRVTRIFLLITMARSPAIKAGISNGFCFVINWYFGIFLVPGWVALLSWIV